MRTSTLFMLCLLVTACQGWPDGKRDDGPSAPPASTSVSVGAGGGGGAGGAANVGSVGSGGAGGAPTRTPAGDSCRATCVQLGAWGCEYISLACYGNATLDVNGAQVPCAWLVSNVCFGGAWNGLVCAAHCPP